MIVMKFGGSSLESASAMERVAAIVRSQTPEVGAVVVSAMGKTTDRLLSIGRQAANGNWQAADTELAALRNYHLEESSRLVRATLAIQLDHLVFAHFAELERVLREISRHRDFNAPQVDAVASFGERLSSLIMTAAFCQAGIAAVHLDAREVIVTDRRHSRAAPLLGKTNQLLRKRVTGPVTVLGGFIGATEDGVTTTLGRGGSDYSAALVAAALGATEIQIWTDVDGMMTCDPRIVSEAHCLRSISYAEAEQMARAGAKVLHPATVLPAVQENIPILIRNSRNPAAPGTRIVAENPADGEVLSIACRTGIELLRLTPRRTPVTSDFGNEIWDAFEAAGVPCELIATTTREMSLLLEAGSLTPPLRSLLEAHAAIEVDQKLALVTLVGQNVSRNPGNLERARRRLIAIPGGAAPGWCSDSRIGFVIGEEWLRAAAKALHEEFFEGLDPATGAAPGVPRQAPPTRLQRDDPPVLKSNFCPIFQL